jgi:hypothetical protein
MENFPSIALIAWKIFHLKLYCNIKHGKIALDFSMFCLYCLISWKIGPNSNQIRNYYLTTDTAKRFARIDVVRFSSVF